jgi:hypothetical protein
MSKNVVKINCEDATVFEFVKLFFINYKDNFSQFIKVMYKNNGEIADPKITIEDNTIIVTKANKSKGFVMVIDGGKPAMVEYNDLAVYDKYMTVTNGACYMFLKTTSADIELGHFKTLEDATMKFDSEEVNEAVSKAKETIAASEQSVEVTK